MYFHLILTDECNLCCSYCRAKAFDLPQDSSPDSQPVELEIDADLPYEFAADLKELYAFLKRDPSPTLTFYGGEPLMRGDLVEKIVREAPVQRFMIQTNGLLLDRLPSAVIHRFTTILVSLDGPEDLTDSHRGSGTYATVMKNVNKIVSNGYAGELIARMTVTEDTDIVSAVQWLSNNPDHAFSSIHWQLDANFSRDFDHRNFERWVQQEYNPGITSLIGEWVSVMERRGIVPRWYPFLDPMEDLLLKRESLLRCGSGHTNYSIMTDGHIAPCPVMIGMSRYYAGHIRDANPLALPTFCPGGECMACSIRTFCGGRCLYSNIVRPWDKRAAELVCSTVMHLKEALENALPRVRQLINENTVHLEDFSHEKFNGCEIIP